MLNFIPARAFAVCEIGYAGYAYVWSSCVQDRTSNPKNVCEVHKDAESTQIVGFYSRVVYAKEFEFIGGDFFDEIQIQYDVTANGRESSCYRHRDEAEKSLRSLMAEHKRSGYKIFRVWMN
jgi:hypothetical protein